MGGTKQSVIYALKHLVIPSVQIIYHRKQLITVLPVVTEYMKETNILKI